MPCNLWEFVEAETFNQASVEKSDMNKVKNSDKFRIKNVTGTVVERCQQT
jgi:hypothetical protein